MKNSFLYMIAYVFLSIGCSNLYASEKILLTTQEWPPYQVYHDKILEGTAVLVVKELLEKMEVPYEIRVYPWERAQFMVKSGSAQGFFLASRNRKRDRYATLSEAIFSQKWNWYLLKNSPLNPTDESFKKATCVLVRFGSNMRYWLSANQYRITGSFKSTEALIKALLAKRCDAMLANELVINKAMKNMQLSPEIFKIYSNKDEPLGRVDLCCTYFIQQYIGSHIIVNASDTILA